MSSVLADAKMRMWDMGQPSQVTYPNAIISIFPKQNVIVLFQLERPVLASHFILGPPTNPMYSPAWYGSLGKLRLSGQKK
jgi:hypothetical protein